MQKEESLKGIDHISDERIKEIETALQNIDDGKESHLAAAPEAPDPGPEKVVESVVSMDAVDDSQVSEAADDSSKEEESSTLPDNYARSLVAAGWTADEIEQQHAALGDEFVQIAEKVHENRKRESREWAAHGRIEATQRAAVEDTARQQTSDTPSEIERLDIAALKKEYGDDPRFASLIDKLGSQTNKAIEAMNAMLPSVAESAVRQEASEKAALQNEVNAFFASLDVLAYKGLYGVGSTQSVDGDHWEQRMKVCEVADQIRVGASYQGREVGFTEALGLAHDSVSADFRVQAIREDIKSKVRQRAGSVTTPPSQGSDTGNTSAPKERTQKTRLELEQNAEIALRQIFPG